MTQVLERKDTNDARKAQDSTDAVKGEFIPRVIRMERSLLASRLREAAAFCRSAPSIWVARPSLTGRVAVVSIEDDVRYATKPAVTDGPFMPLPSSGKESFPRQRRSGYQNYLALEVEQVAC
jgi:hypothetical protein